MTVETGMLGFGSGVLGLAVACLCRLEFECEKLYCRVTSLWMKLTTLVVCRSHSQRASGYVWETFWDTGFERKWVEKGKILPEGAVNVAVASKVTLCSTTQLIEAMFSWYSS